MLASALLPSVYLLASALLSLGKRAFGVTSDPTTANNQTFDYIIVGGGLAGLTVASRLTEDPSKTILVIEAGNDDRNDPRVFDVLEYGVAFGTSLDWAWPTDQGKIIHSGRTLGGSSSINGAAITRGIKGQYDAFSKVLSNEEASLEWNWDSLFSYMKKSEGFNPPDKQQRADGADYNPAYHGFIGPVQVAYAQGMYSGPAQPAFDEAIRNLSGIARCQDGLGGNDNCVSHVANSINPKDNGRRSSSAQAYLTPVENERTNWLTLINNRVTKVLLSGSAPNVRATGVQFKNSNNTGDTFTVHARKEVILSAGAIASPQLLQLSGIGDPSVLDPLGIDVRVNLPTVGRNFQTQTRNDVASNTQPSFDAGGTGPDHAIAFLNLYELFSEGAGSNGSVTGSDIARHILTEYPSWAQSQAVNGLNADALTTIFGIQADLIVNHNAPVSEFYFQIGSSGSGVNNTLFDLLQFSRGNITITDTSVFTDPKVTVNWFDVDYDLDVQTAGGRLGRKVLNHKALASIVTDEYSPGLDVVPDDGNAGTDDAWQSWVHDTFLAVYHEVGSTSMMRRDLGGVVDGKLRVYDTVNLRVVDAGVIPFQVSAHTSETLYGVAEKAADIIRSGV
ncbi:glucose oxidase [Fomitiporia mediterranea MF3/22]|uniref:glucose oxidase n=1 Tax=Fomitiporia mediterranea (strain MF3/22) TaxID=694068 RepID=UPI0004408B5E|nr:glucose oxidase [Fomitiporia mediterranea MF3/22]EJC99457.1 glucose oxidase [Fomitiporia mediterranea MF3/22]